MSLSAAEKVRVVEALDRLGVHYIEAGFPSSNPKEAELFGLLAGVELETAQVCAFGMTRRRGLAAEDDPALQELVGVPSAGVHPGRQDLVASPRQGDQGHPRREPRHDHRLDLPAARRMASGSSTTPSTSSTPGARTRAYALDCLRAAVAAGAENVTLCDTNGSSLPAAGRRGDRRGRRGAGGPRRGRASTRTTTPSARSPTRSPRWTRARAWSRGR